MQNVIKRTPIQIEDECVYVGKAMENIGLTGVTRDYLWNHCVLKYGTPFGKDGKPIGPGGVVITKQMMIRIAKRISDKAQYKDTSTRNRNKIVF